MTPGEIVLVDDIRLGDPAFWKLATEERERAFSTLRSRRPVSFHSEQSDGPLPAGPGFWALSRHRDIVYAGTNPKVFCSGKGATSIPDLPNLFLEFFGSMINMDQPKHGRLRRLVSQAFTVAQLSRLKHEIENHARNVIDSVIEKGECDFVTEIAAPFAISVICDLMGIPESEHRFVFAQTNVILGSRDPEYIAEAGTNEGVALLAAGAALTKLMRALRLERLKRPSNDITSVLAHAELDGDGLSEQEMASFFILLVTAGNDTTRNAISHGMRALADFPEEKAIWRADFDTVAPTAVEEIIRWASPVIFMRRTAIQDTMIGGQNIRAGEKVVLFYNSGNRDETVFENSYRFDVHRNPNDHLGFGAGPHFCLGANLARFEIEVMFREILSRMPDLVITGVPQILLSPFIHGIKHIPCRWTPAPRSSGK